MGVLARLRKMGVPWPGVMAAVSSVFRLGHPLTREKARTGFGGGLPGGKVTFLPYLDNLSAETTEIRQAYREMLRDPTVKGSLYSKLFGTASLELHAVSPVPGRLHKRVAQMVQDTLQRAKGGVPALVKATAFGGLVEGYSHSEKVWKLLERGEWAGKIALHDLKPKDTLNFQLEVDEFRNVTGLKGTKFDGGVVWPPEFFVIWQHNPIYGHPAGMSDFRAAYRAFWNIDTCWKLRRIGGAKFARGMLLGTYSDNTVKADVEQMLQEASDNTWGVIPESVKVEVLSWAGQNQADWTAWLKDAQQEVAVGIAGAVLQMMEGAGSNSRGDTKVHMQTSDLRVWDLANSLASCWQDQVVTDLVDLNFVGAEYPTLTLSAIDDAAMKASLEIDAGLRNQLGVSLSKEDIAKRYGRAIPQGPEDTLPPPAPPQPGLNGVGVALPFTDPQATNQPAPQPDYISVPEEFDDSGDQVALAGPDGAQAAKLLARAKADGVQVLTDIVASAAARLAQRGKGARSATDLFDDDERQKLADMLARTNATAELLGRARIRERANLVSENVEQFSEKPTPFAAFAEAPAPLPPEQALSYFRGLVPELGVDPKRFGARQERHAFTLAKATEDLLLRQVKDMIAEALQGDATPRETALDIASVLGDPGKQDDERSNRIRRYAEMVTRTNLMDSFNTGAQREMQDSDVAEVFPVWKYVGIRDGRQRAAHSKHFDHYFDNATDFSEVRDSVKGDYDGFNCRCTMIPVDKFEWQKLQPGGATVSTFGELLPKSVANAVHEMKEMIRGLDDMVINVPAPVVNLTANMPPTPEPVIKFSESQPTNGLTADAIGTAVGAAVAPAFTAFAKAMEALIEGLKQAPQEPPEPKKVRFDLQHNRNGDVTSVTRVEE